MEQVWLMATIWITLALVASLISVRIGVSVALVEILIGSLGGNFLGLHPTDWISVLAAFGSVVLTFLAGTEIDPQVLRKQWEKSLSTGLTFGTLSALYGLNHDLITQEQYTILVTAVILSGVIPTLIAERWFDPHSSSKERSGVSKGEGSRENFNLQDKRR